MVAMFLALRDIRFAKGRFALMTAVVVLVALLLVLLSCLTRGLGEQSTSAVAGLPSGTLMLAPSQGSTTWADSQVSDAQRRQVARSVAAEPLAVGHGRMAHDGKAATVATFSVQSSGRLAAGLPAPLGSDGVVLPRSVATDLGAAAGSTVQLDGRTLRVVGMQDDRWYSHSPVVWMPRATGSPVTALFSPDQRAVTAARDAGLVATTAKDSTSLLPGYRSEHGSLLMIQAFLYGIGGLVVMSFLSVWTLQRTRDLAVLRALGSSRRHVLGDTLGQALLLLAVGSLVGGVAGTAIALVARGAVPVALAATTTLLPALGVLLVGMLGAVVATRSVTRVDPLLALGGN